MFTVLTQSPDGTVNLFYCVHKQEKPIEWDGKRVLKTMYKTLEKEVRNRYKYNYIVNVCENFKYGTYMRKTKTCIISQKGVWCQGVKGIRKKRNLSFELTDLNQF